MPRWVIFWGLGLFSACAWGQLYPSDVLVLVNENSPTSRYIAKLYRAYHPQVPESQILSLQGLVDCSGPTSTAADEIITREQYEELVAGPVRAYLVDNDLVNTIKVIVTTAGLPYRIEDSANGNIVQPAGGSAYDASNLGNITAASVESELTVLFQNDPAGDPSRLLPTNDRVANPYQGYRNSGAELFSRDIFGNLANMIWRYPRRTSPTHYPPIMEGASSTMYGVAGRHFSCGDMYLTCRLDGPKQQGRSAAFAVRSMLERARRASMPSVGVNPALAVVVYDDAPGASDHDYNRLYNLDSNVDYIVYDACTAQPPNTNYINKSNDYESGFEQMTGLDAVEGALCEGFFSMGWDVRVVEDWRAEHRTNQADLGVDELVVAAASYGRNGDEGSAKDYPFTGGPNGGNLFDATNGAVFTSIESYNAVTMFSNAVSSQAKIIDFIEIGGTAAIGHCFEPYEDAVIDNEFLFYNLLADADGNGQADMTFVEAAFTALPYLSWSEVAIGDPLMQISYGPGQKAWNQVYGDANNDGRVNFGDITIIRMKSGGALYSDDHAAFNLYDDLCDVNKDGRVNFGDVTLARSNLGAVADW